MEHYRNVVVLSIQSNSNLKSLLFLPIGCSQQHLLGVPFATSVGKKLRTIGIGSKVSRKPPVKF